MSAVLPPVYTEQLFLDKNISKNSFAVPVDRQIVVTNIGVFNGAESGGTFQFRIDEVVVCFFLLPGAFQGENFLWTGKAVALPGQVLFWQSVGPFIDVHATGYVFQV